MSDLKKNRPQPAVLDTIDKPTLVLGASLKPHRTSYVAVNMLRQNGHTVYALGGRIGMIHGVQVERATPEAQLPEVHTVSLYMNEQRQAPFIDFILGLRPRRIIFNPGAENEILFQKAKEAGIEVKEACTLVMLNFRQF
ncbi:MAG: CoA-binding protein [Bacteroidota bacterium]